VPFRFRYQQSLYRCITCQDVAFSSHQGCQVVISKIGQINPWKEPNSNKKAKYKINTRNLWNTQTRFQKAIYTVHILYIKRTKLPNNSINKLLETFGLAEENLKAWNSKTKNYKLSCRVSDKKLSFCVHKQCLETCQYSEIWQSHL